ncbi:glycerate kinase family protein [Lachnospira pectinoschiza]|uniref:Glycerate kinase n=1 Tax=Lachnospira pectinoschiza TaxID=28052 RepID=A0A1G9T2E1_9FIRM|nr:glycerate kinase [Lachnospira pectinoschiza]SDM41879.1 glycerate kinase [Lachnospira pectinoschiza]
MKVLVAIDSFKGSLTSMEAGEACKRGILKAYEETDKLKKEDIVVKPLADGGEGTTEALITGLGGKLIKLEVTGPDKKKVFAQYGILADNKTAVIEMAESSGITLVKREELNPWKATTFGLGEILKDALDRGCREFIIGIGGSATTEVGFGMLQAIGYKFFDKDNKELSYDFENLANVEKIDASGLDKRFDDCHFNIACDVNNPLYGERGAVYIFGPQKGVKADEKELMDSYVKHFASVADKEMSTNYDLLEGAGAAGGLGFAFKTFFKNVDLNPGIDIVLKAISLEEELNDTDIVVTGEGQLDGQTAMGKVPVGVSKLAKKYGCTVLAIAGGVTRDATACNHEGIDAFFPIVRGVTSLDEAMMPQNATKNLEESVEQIFRLIYNVSYNN